VERGIWVPTQHLLWDKLKLGKTLIELAKLLAVFFDLRDIASDRTAQKTQALFLYATTELVYAVFCRVRNLLPNSSCNIVAYFAIVEYQRVFTYFIACLLVVV
jgi:hypothetical protein